jgi:large conductance mechanosensitive channel
MKPLKNFAAIDPAKKAFTLFDEFKRFTFQGTVIDMAVGVIIGAAFGKIIDSLVKHIIMPFISLLIPGDKGYLGWKLVVGAKEVPYGLFIGEVVNFIIVTAAVFFFIVKFLGWLMRSRQKPAPTPPSPSLTKEQELLMEIRDLLKDRQ